LGKGAIIASVNETCEGGNVPEKLPRPCHGCGHSQPAGPLLTDRVPAGSQLSASSPVLWWHLAELIGWSGHQTLAWFCSAAR